MTVKNRSKGTGIGGWHAASEGYWRARGDGLKPAALCSVKRKTRT